MLEKSGDNIFILIIIAISGVFVICFAVFYLVIAYIKKTARHRDEIQQKEIEYQARLFSSIIASQEEERRLIGKELHDEVSSVLYAIRLRLQSNPTEENISNLMAVDKIIGITRNISHLLSPPEIEMLGFHDSIKQLCSNFSNNHTELKIELQDTTGEFIPVQNFQLSLMLYRIIQELITNTVKHAHATHIHITIQNTGSEFKITYKDNGIGIDEGKKIDGSLGFKNIISRLLLIKAEYDFITNDGFRFELSLNHQHIFTHG